MNPQRVEETLNDINRYGNSNQGMNRTAFSSQEEDAKDYLIDLFKELGMTVRTDAFGNMIARREGDDSSLPAVACGSHIDTVYNAGKYDGTVGVVAGIEVVRFLNDNDIKTKHPVEIIVFACEESARFGMATVGSKAMTGMIGIEELTTLKDKENITIGEAMESAGYNIHNIREARREKSELKSFYEIHIEQGPVLEEKEKQIGIVTGIAAPTRYRLKIMGESAHSGSTPMNMRKDAFSGASEIALTLEAAAKDEKQYGTVATIGNCEVLGGAMNVVPGEVEVIIDIRSTSIPSKERVSKALMERIDEIRQERNLQVQITEICDDKPTIMDEKIIDSLEKACKQIGLSSLKMPSGAGHDSMNMAKVFPTGLIFVPSVKGISHNKEEYTSTEDIMAGVTLLKEVILEEACAVNKAYC